MSRRLQENLVAGFVLLVFVATIVAASQYGPRARLVPIPIAALGAILIGAQLVMQNLRSPKSLEIDLLELISRKATGEGETGAGAAAADAPRAKGGAATFRGELLAVGIVALLLAMYLLIGPLPTIFLFTAGYFVVSGHFGVVRGVIYSFAFTAAVYALFHVWLRVDMKQGLFDLGFGLW